MDLPAVEGGDVFKISVNDLFLDESDDPVAVTQAMLESEIPAEIPGKKSRRMNIAAILRRETQAVKENERLFEAAAMKHFTDQQAQISSSLGIKAKDDLFSSLADYMLPDGTFNPELWAMLPEAEQIRLAEGIAAGLLDWNTEAEKLAKMFHPLWKKAYDDGVSISEEGYGIYAVERPEFVSPAKINGYHSQGDFRRIEPDPLERCHSIRDGDYKKAGKADSPSGNHDGPCDWTI